MDLQLKGRRALVTGGSKGIGRAIALALADEGADVAICARGADALEQTLGEIRGRGVRAVGGAVDVGDEEAFPTWVASAIGELGGLDVLVPNTSGMAFGEDDAPWQESFRVDVMHTVRAVRAAEEALVASGVGSIVIISSISANMNDVGPTHYAYGAAKAALVSYGSELAFQLAPKGVRVNVVSPGSIDFPGGVWDRMHQDAPDYWEAVRAATPLGRYGTPEEIAAAVAFLASPVSAWTTGVNLKVDGGRLRTVDF
ncbi:MAG: SDR family oxidoreductase [Thermoleophilia bacterium]